MFRHHIAALVFRFLLLLLSVCLYFTDIESLNFTVMPRFNFGGILLIVIMITLVVGMLYRIIPNKRIPIGARKHFDCSYSEVVVKPSDKQITLAQKQLQKGAFLSGLGWALVTATLLCTLWLIDSLSPAAVILITLFYSVIDLVFILIFCPFKNLFMKNRCCAVCRIYNWDYFMMCAPLIVFPSLYSTTLFLLSVAVLLRWEIAIKKHPNFFIAEMNENLGCDRCNSDN